MSERIDDYLAALRDALAGADPATVRDALSDAEEHLRTAGKETEEDMDRIIDDYGSPREVASAYIEAESRTEPPLAGDDGGGSGPIGRFFGIIASPRAWGGLLYMLFALITGIVYFTFAVTGISLSAGLAVLIIGLPFFGLFLLAARGLTLVEGRLVEALSGIRMPRRPVFARKDLGIWRSFKSLVGDRRTWLGLLYMILQLPLGVIYFTVATVLIALSAMMILRPLLEHTFGIPFMHVGGYDYWTPGWFMPLAVVIGILLLFASLHLSRAVVRMHGRLAKFMLVG